MPVAYNAQTGEGKYLGSDNTWQTAKVAKNAAGDVQIYDGSNWTPVPKEQPKSPGLMDKLKGRFGEAVKSVGLQDQGKQNAFETGEQILGKTIGGGINDIVGSGIEKLIPDSIEKNASKIGSKIANTEIGKAGIQAAQKGAEYYSNWAKQNPRAARDLESAVDISTIIPIGKVASVAKEVLPKAISPVSNLTKGLVENIKGKGVQDIGQNAFNKTMKNSYSPEEKVQDIGAIKKLQLGMKARKPDQLEQRANQMRSAAVQTLNGSGYKDVQLSGKQVQGVIDTVEKEIKKEIPLNKGLHGLSIGVLRQFRERAKTGAMSMQEIEQYRQLLRQVVSKTIKKDDPDTVVAMQAIEHLDNALEDLPESSFAVTGGSGKDTLNILKQYRSQYRNAKTFERISDMIKSSGGDANKIRSKFEKFASKEQNMKPLTEQERAAVKALANPSGADKALRAAGTLGVNPAKSNAGGFVPLVEGLSALYNKTPVMPLIGGTLANLYRNMSTKGEVENLLQMIEQGKNAQK